MDVPPNHYGICSAGNTRAVPRIKADSGRILSALDSKDGFKKWAELLSREIGLCPLFFKAGYPHRVLLVAKAFFRKKLEGDFVPFLGRGMFRHPDTQERRSCAVCGAQKHDGTVQIADHTVNKRRIRSPAKHNSTLRNDDRGRLRFGFERQDDTPAVDLHAAAARRGRQEVGVARKPRRADGGGVAKERIHIRDRAGNAVFHDADRPAVAAALAEIMADP